MKLENPTNPKVERISIKQMRPFLVAAALWGAAGAGIVALLVREGTTAHALGWWALFYVFSLLDLGVLAGLVAAMLAGPPQGDKARWAVRLAFLGVSKATILIIGAILMMRNHGIPNSSLLSGLGTLIVVPLLGGGIWSFSSTKE